MIPDLRRDRLGSSIRFYQHGANSKRSLLTKPKFHCSSPEEEKKMI